MAVLYRQFHEVKRLAKNLNNSCQCGLAKNWSAFSLLELALGWEEGLSYLVSLDLCPFSAIQLACLVRDNVSLRILLRTKAPIFSPIPFQYGYETWVQEEDAL